MISIAIMKYTTYNRHTMSAQKYFNLVIGIDCITLYRF